MLERGVLTFELAKLQSENWGSGGLRPGGTRGRRPHWGDLRGAKAPFNKKRSHFSTKKGPKNQLFRLLLPLYAHFWPPLYLLSELQRAPWRGVRSTPLKFYLVRAKKTSESLRGKPFMRQRIIIIKRLVRSVFSLDSHKTMDKFIDDNQKVIVTYGSQE